MQIRRTGADRIAYAQSCVEREKNKRSGNGNIVDNRHEKITVWLDIKTSKELGRLAYEKGITKPAVIRAVVMNYCRTSI